MILYEPLACYSTGLEVTPSNVWGTGCYVAGELGEYLSMKSVALPSREQLDCLRPG